MKIAFFGTGYVGLVNGTCLSELGNDVICVDIDEDKINNLNKGIIPIYEPGLEELITRNVKSDRLKFTTNSKKTIETSDIIYIAVGTPPDQNGKADLKYVFEVATEIGQNLNKYKVIVNKSTVPVGTGKKVEEIVQQYTNQEFDVISNPEFLKEGAAVNDFFNPDRIVVGTDSQRAQKIMEELYNPLARTDRPLIFTDIHSSELIKYASNAMLATRISFVNMLSHLCESTGANIKHVAKGMGLDSRIGSKFLQAGIGYGGSCFPKDVSALAETLKEYNCDSSLLDSVIQTNYNQIQSINKKIDILLPDIDGKTVSILGLAFKPKTDDMREAPALSVIEYLKRNGANIKAYDPVAQENAKLIHPDITYCKNPYECIEGSDLTILTTEWNEFRNLDKSKKLQIMNQPNFIDCRNVHKPQDMIDAGFNYISVGR